MVLPPPPPALPLHARPPDWRRWLPGSPLSSLLEALNGHPAVGWMLKSLPGFGYARWGGHLPMADSRLSRHPEVDPITGQVTLAPGQTDIQHFEPIQAAALRLADQRALRLGTPCSETHELETRVREEGIVGVAWRTWRTVLAAAAQPLRSDSELAEPHLLVVWMDLNHADRTDRLLALARRQLQAQQLLIAELRSQLPAQAPLTAHPDTLAWAAHHFTQQLAREIDLSRREQRSFALLLLSFGDRPMQASTEQAVGALLARQLSTGTRVMDTVAQIGPRRFAVILSGAPLTPAYGRAEALRRELATQLAVSDAGADPIHLYIGVAAYSLIADQAGTLMAAAEAALAEALQSPQGSTVLARVAVGAPPAPSPRFFNRSTQP